MIAQSYNIAESNNMIKNKYKCYECNVKICSSSILCNKCMGKSKRKITRPDRKMLFGELK